MSRHRAGGRPAMARLFAPLNDWEADAACRTAEDPEVMFPIGLSDDKAIAAGLALCDICPVVAQCLDWAVSTRQEYGTLGGTTEWDRAALIPRGPRVAVGSYGD